LSELACFALQHVFSDVLRKVLKDTGVVCVASDEVIKWLNQVTPADFFKMVKDPEDFLNLMDHCLGGQLQYWLIQVLDVVIKNEKAKEDAAAADAPKKEEPPKKEPAQAEPPKEGAGALQGEQKPEAAKKEEKQEDKPMTNSEVAKYLKDQITEIDASSVGALLGGIQAVIIKDFSKSSKTQIQADVLLTKIAEVLATDENIGLPAAGFPEEEIQKAKKQLPLTYLQMVDEASMVNKSGGVLKSLVPRVAVGIVASLVTDLLNRQLTTLGSSNKVEIKVSDVLGGFWSPLDFVKKFAPILEDVATVQLGIILKKNMKIPDFEPSVVLQSISSITLEELGDLANKIHSPDDVAWTNLLHQLEPAIEQIFKALVLPAIRNNVPDDLGVEDGSPIQTGELKAAFIDAMRRATGLDLKDFVSSILYNLSLVGEKEMNQCLAKLGQSLALKLQSLGCDAETVGKFQYLQTTFFLGYEYGQCTVADPDDPDNNFFYFAGPTSYACIASVPGLLEGSSHPTIVGEIRNKKFEEAVLYDDDKMPQKAIMRNTPKWQGWDRLSEFDRKELVAKYPAWSTSKPLDDSVRNYEEVMKTLLNMFAAAGLEIMKTLLLDGLKAIGITIDEGDIDLLPPLLPIIETIAKQPHPGSVLISSVRLTWPVFLSWLLRIAVKSAKAEIEKLNQANDMNITLNDNELTLLISAAMKPFMGDLQCFDVHRWMEGEVTCPYCSKSLEAGPEKEHNWTCSSCYTTKEAETKCMTCKDEQCIGRNYFTLCQKCSGEPEENVLKIAMLRVIKEVVLKELEHSDKRQDFDRKALIKALKEAEDGQTIAEFMKSIAQKLADQEIAYVSWGWYEFIKEHQDSLVNKYGIPLNLVKRLARIKFSKVLESALVTVDVDEEPHKCKECDKGRLDGEACLCESGKEVDGIEGISTVEELQDACKRFTARFAIAWLAKHLQPEMINVMGQLVQRLPFVSEEAEQMKEDFGSIKPKDVYNMFMDICHIMKLYEQNPGITVDQVMEDEQVKNVLSGVLEVIKTVTIRILVDELKQGLTHFATWLQARIDALPEINGVKFQFTLPPMEGPGSICEAITPEMVKKLNEPTAFFDKLLPAVQEWVVHAVLGENVRRWLVAAGLEKEDVKNVCDLITAENLKELVITQDNPEVLKQAQEAFIKIASAFITNLVFQADAPGVLAPYIPDKKMNSTIYENLKKVTAKDVESILTPDEPGGKTHWQKAQEVLERVLKGIEHDIFKMLSDTMVGKASGWLKEEQVKALQASGYVLEGAKKQEDNVTRELTKTNDLINKNCTTMAKHTQKLIENFSLEKLKDEFIACKDPFLELFLTWVKSMCLPAIMAIFQKVDLPGADFALKFWTNIQVKDLELLAMDEASVKEFFKKLMEADDVRGDVQKRIQQIAKRELKSIPERVGEALMSDECNLDGLRTSWERKITEDLYDGIVAKVADDEMGRGAVTTKGSAINVMKRALEALLTNRSEDTGKSEKYVEADQLQPVTWPYWRDLLEPMPADKPVLSIADDNEEIEVKITAAGILQETVAAVKSKEHYPPSSTQIFLRVEDDPRQAKDDSFKGTRLKVTMTMVVTKKQDKPAVKLAEEVETYRPYEWKTLALAGFADQEPTGIDVVGTKDATKSLPPGNYEIALQRSQGKLTKADKYNLFLVPRTSFNAFEWILINWGFLPDKEFYYQPKAKKSRNVAKDLWAATFFNDDADPTSIAAKLTDMAQTLVCERTFFHFLWQLGWTPEETEMPWAARRWTWVTPDNSGLWKMSGGSKDLINMLKTFSEERLWMAAAKYVMRGINFHGRIVHTYAIPQSDVLQYTDFEEYRQGHKKDWIAYVTSITNKDLLYNKYKALAKLDEESGTAIDLKTLNESQHWPFWLNRIWISDSQCPDADGFKSTKVKLLWQSSLLVFFQRVQCVGVGEFTQGSNMVSLDGLKASKGGALVDPLGKNAKFRRVDDKNDNYRSLGQMKKWVNEIKVFYNLKGKSYFPFRGLSLDNFIRMNNLMKCMPSDKALFFECLEFQNRKMLKLLDKDGKVLKGPLTDDQIAKVATRDAADFANKGLFETVHLQYLEPWMDSKEWNHITCETFVDYIRETKLGIPQEKAESIFKAIVDCRKPADAATDSSQAEKSSPSSQPQADSGGDASQKKGAAQGSEGGAKKKWPISKAKSKDEAMKEELGTDIITIEECNNALRSYTTGNLWKDAVEVLINTSFPSKIRKMALHNLDAAFDELDSNKRGTLSPSEVGTLIRTLLQPGVPVETFESAICDSDFLGFQVPRSLIHELTDFVDINKDGYLTAKEFINLFHLILNSHMPKMVTEKMGLTGKQIFLLIAEILLDILLLFAMITLIITSFTSGTGIAQVIHTVFSGASVLIVKAQANKNVETEAKKMLEYAKNFAVEEISVALNLNRTAIQELKSAIANVGPGKDKGKEKQD